MKKALIVSCVDVETISPVSFLRGYVEKRGNRLDEYAIQEGDNFAKTKKDLMKLAPNYDLIGLSSWDVEESRLLKLFRFFRDKLGKVTVVGGPGEASI